jgi:riboflavin synthase alpha subunit
LQPQVGSGTLSQGQELPVTTGNSSQAHGVCVTIGRCSHGHAAFAVLKEHVAIPTAIAAATVSFLIVILTSFYLSNLKDLFFGF